MVMMMSAIGNVYYGRLSLLPMNVCSAFERGYNDSPFGIGHFRQLLTREEHRAFSPECDHNQARGLFVALLIAL